jgi:hypothetical protein
VNADGPASGSVTSEQTHRSISVLCRLLLDVIDHQHLHGALPFLDLQAKLLLNRIKYARTIGYARGIGDQRPAFPDAQQPIPSLASESDGVPTNILSKKPFLSRYL